MYVFAIYLDKLISRMFTVGTYNWNWNSGSKGSWDSEVGFVY